MPRHIRSVTARRTPKIARPAKGVETVAVPEPKAELFEGLRQAFEATPEIPETPARTRERYVDALASLADYLETIGADAAWIEHLDALGFALEDLTKGAVPPVLAPKAPGRPSPALKQP